MSELSSLAELLEKAAATLRKAEAALSEMPKSTVPYISSLRFYWDLSPRIRNILNSEGVDTVQQLCDQSEESFLEMRNLGEISLCEIKEFMVANGLPLKKYLTRP